MAKEKFLIIAVPMTDDCFSRFSETENRQRIESGEPSPSDAYAWIEKTFEIRLIRHREATHICSLTPSSRYEFLANYFVGEPNEAWIYDGDPDGLESENGGEHGGYGAYRDDYDSRFIVDSFMVDTMRDLPEPMRKPRGSAMMKSRRRMTARERNAEDRQEAAHDAYHDAVWEAALNVAHELGRNTDWGTAPILNVFTYRQWECGRLNKVRSQSQAAYPHSAERQDVDHKKAEL